MPETIMDVEIDPEVPPEDIFAREGSAAPDEGVGAQRPFRQHGGRLFPRSTIARGGVLSERTRREPPTAMRANRARQRDVLVTSRCFI